ncbi:MAG: TonB-dependent receptor [Pseudomonadota bacterium]
MRPWKRESMTLFGLAAAIFAAAGSNAFAQSEVPQSDAKFLEEVFIVGDADAVKALPGSAARISAEQISIEIANDINQLLKTVPGVYIREEEGYGLRPNIGIRGATSERSSKITIMEDGVLVAPAPYSNPAAYYFPTTLRANTVEVLKGAPLLRYGPQTTGGVVNIVSTPIPEAFGGNLEIRAGENDEADLLASIGGRTENHIGYLLETAQRRSDGFKDIDRGGGSGFNIEDYVVKMSWENGPHSVLLKGQYSRETSDETYLGLSDVDFDRSPNRRYGLSTIDEMNTRHSSYSVRYGIDLHDNARLNVLAYKNDFKRDWFRFESGLQVIELANAGDEAALALVDGTADAFNLQFRSRNREFDSSGIELNIDQRWGNHSLAYGVRFHDDEMDRYQPGFTYDQIDGELVFFEAQGATDSNNRLEEAEALSAWFVDNWTPNERLNLNLTLRYEEVESSRRQFARDDRSDEPLQRSNNSSELLPGASFTYALSEKWQILAGIHRGFSPLGGGAQAFEDPETSTNWEGGIRYQSRLFFEAIAFRSDFSNKSENCSDANPCSNGQTTGSFTTGDAVIQGLEVQASTVLELFDVTIPVDFTYTYTDATVSEDNPAEGFENGDQLASVPEHAYSVRVGFETNFNWNNYLVIKYIDETCVRIGCNDDSNPFNRTDDLILTDLISRYSLRDNAVVFFKLENLFDEQDIVSRQPEGARPNKPRTASVGIQYTF